MQERFFKPHIDSVGFVAATLCAIHCISLPLILSIGVLSGSTWLENEALELGFIGASLLIALSSLIPSYLKNHRRPDALLISGLGFGIIMSHSLVESLEPVLMFVGGSCVALAHWYNWRLTRRMKYARA
ncbi:MAG: MerC domain-containing protein [Bacteroidota bacterium]